MTRRFPLLPTVLVALAVATMIGLGVWQLQRAGWKEDLLARIETNRALPVTFYPMVPSDYEIEDFFFRRASDYCLGPVTVRATSGRNMQGVSGWSHLATCRSLRPELPGMIVDIGWSATHAAPPPWAGGPVEGVIVPDTKTLIRLVATTPAPGLEPSQPPGPDTIPNNHRLYAAQWFFFAAAAALIYWLALRRRAEAPA